MPPTNDSDSDSILDFFGAFIVISTILICLFALFFGAFKDSEISDEGYKEVNILVKENPDLDVKEFFDDEKISVSEYLKMREIVKTKNSNKAKFKEAHAK